MSYAHISLYVLDIVDALSQNTEMIAKFEHCHQPNG